MRLTKEHIGKKVRDKDWTMGAFITLEWIRENYIAGVDDKGNAFFQDIVNSSNNWELVEEPKKPSERLKELVAGDYILTNSPHSDLNKSGYYANLRIEVIIKFLDELHEKGKI